MKKLIKNTLITLIVCIVGYNSVYFKKLSNTKSETVQKFDAVSFSKALWENQMQTKMDSAVQLSSLVMAINTDKEAALKKYTNTLGIGNYRYALIKTNGIVTNISDDETALQVTANGSSLNTIIATEYIYGNAIRDASALISINDYPNSTDLNSISEELNKIVRSTVLPPFRKTVKKGDRVTLVAAVELNKEHIKWNGLELLPLSIQIQP